MSSTFSHKCPKCKHEISIDNMWRNELPCDKHRDPPRLIRRSLKYDCPKCNYYQSWFLDPTVTGCINCKEDGEIQKTLFKRYQSGEPCKFTVDMSVCLESYPCKHSVGFVFEDGQTLTTNGMDGGSIAKEFKDRGIEVPEHFKDYLS